MAGENDKAADHFMDVLLWSRRLGEKISLFGALSGLGVVAAVSGQAHRAVCLHTASELLYSNMGFSFFMDPHQSAWFERHLASARARLGEENFAAAWMEGQVLAEEQDVNHALVGNLPSVVSITQRI